MSIEKLFHEFIEKYEIPKDRIKKGIEDNYNKEAQYYLENYEWPNKRGGITTEEGVAYYFRASLYDKILDWHLRQKISSIEIPLETARDLFEKSKRLGCYRLAKVIRKVCKNKLPEIITPPRHEEPSIPLDRIIISLRKGKPRKIEDVISEMELKSYLKELANSKNLDKKEKIQESYRIELKQNSCTYSEVGTLDYSVIQTQKLYEESGIPFEERTVKLAYSILLEKENTRLGYINTLDFLLWLKETTGIKPKEKLIKKALSSLISISFNHRNPKSYFEKLEKLGETRITDLLNESETNQLKRVYFYAVKYFESEKMRGLESVTGIKPNLTEEAYQRIYLRSFEHEGVAEMYKIYKHYLVPPSEEFFARFVERYANITMENKFERKFISDVL